MRRGQACTLKLTLLSYTAKFSVSSIYLSSPCTLRFPTSQLGNAFLGNALGKKYILDVKPLATLGSHETEAFVLNRLKPEEDLIFKPADVHAF